MKSVQDTLEEVRMKMEDLERWETLTNESSQSIDYRLQKLEEIAEQTASNLAVIHRFMAVGGSPMGSGHLLDPRADLPSESPADLKRTRMTSHSSNKEALQDLQQVHDNLVIDQKIEKPILSREGTIESETIDDNEVIKAEEDENVDEILVNSPARRLSESSTGENAMKMRSSIRKKATQKRATPHRLRHASDSSTDLRNSLHRNRKPTKNRLGVYRSMRYRKRTESTKSAENANETDNCRKKHKSQDDYDHDLEVDPDEIYDEFDLLAEMRVPKRSRATSGSGPGYMRSLSDVVHHVGVPTTTTGNLENNLKINNFPP